MKKIPCVFNLSLMSYFYNKFYRVGQRHPQPKLQAAPDFQIPPMEAAGMPNNRSPTEPLVVPDTSRSLSEARVNLHERRWRTMKNDKDWYTYNDVPRRYSPSDYTGFAKRMFGWTFEPFELLFPVMDHKRKPLNTFCVASAVAAAFVIFIIARFGANWKKNSLRSTKINFFKPHLHR